MCVLPVFDCMFLLVCLGSGGVATCQISDDHRVYLQTEVTDHTASREPSIIDWPMLESSQ